MYNHLFHRLLEPQVNRGGWGGWGVSYASNNGKCFSSNLTSHIVNITPLIQADPNWIKGAGVAGEPTAADPPLNAFSMQSVDWSKLLTTGKHYRLRQNFYRGEKKTSAFDVAYSFTYEGFVTQNDAIQAKGNQAFTLHDREVCQDTTRIAWATAVGKQMRFWLPIVDGAEDLIKAGASVYTGCGGFAYDSDGCGLNIDTARRYGNAGIIPDAKGNNSDLSASWAPLMDTASRNGGAHDLILIRNGKKSDDVQGSVYGNLGGQGGQRHLRHFLKP